MKYRIGTLLLAATFAGVVPAPAVFAQDVEQVQSLANQIEGLEVAEQGGVIYLHLTMKQPLTTPPASFSVASPARIAFDFPDTGNALGRTVQAIERGDLRSANIVQAGDRTRLVLNLVKTSPYDTTIDGRNVVIAIRPNAAQDTQRSVVAQAQGNFAESRSATAAGAAVRDVQFRRGADGEGRVVVDLSSSDTGIDIRQQGGNLVVEFLKSSLPEHLKRRSDVVDFGTPVTAMTMQQSGDNVRLTVTPNGLWEHNAYQSDNRFVLEVKRVVPDPNRLVEGATGKFQGEKLSLNFQNVDVRSVLQVIADFTNINIVTSDAVEGTVTLRLKDVPWDQALEVVLQAKGLSYIKTGDVIWVATAQQIIDQQAKEASRQEMDRVLESLQTEVFQINYHDAETIAGLIQAEVKGPKTTVRTEGSGASRNVSLAASGRGSDTATRQTSVDTKRINMLSERGSVTADVQSNKLFVNDVAANRAQIAKFIKDIDIPARQVLIEARIVEARTDFARDLGVRLGVGGASGRIVGYTADGAPVRRGTFGGSLEQTSINAGLVANTTDVVPRSTNIDLGAAPSYGNAGLISGVLWNNAATRFLSLELSALESRGQGRIMSSPRILTANYGTATISQGDKINVLAVIDGEPTLKEIDATLRLTVKPAITPDGRVHLELDVMKDRADFSRVVTGVPAIDSRQAKTRVLVENGGTVVIGGVAEEDETDTTTQVPLLGDIPVVGNLFKTQERRQSAENFSSSSLPASSPTA